MFDRLPPCVQLAGFNVPSRSVYFTTASGFTPLGPARFLDSRRGFGTIDGQFAGIGALGGFSQLDLTLAGRGGLPSAGANAVVMNVTATTSTADGFLTIWPSETSRPLASNLNFGPGRTVPNLAISQIGANGSISIFNSAGLTNIIADVAGWFPLASELRAVTPTRVLDTRANMQTFDHTFAGIGPLSAGATLDLPLVGRDRLPPSGVGAVVLNVTATNPTASGFLTVWPTNSALPNASTLNFTPGRTVPNLVISAVGSNGSVSLFNSAGSTDVVVDVVGWIAN